MFKLRKIVIHALAISKWIQLNNGILKLSLG